jgi:Leucine-rich repeat (LRR) protein
MRSIEELDLSDNFITFMPEQIRYMPALKRV